MRTQAMFLQEYLEIAVGEFIALVNEIVYEIGQLDRRVGLRCLRRKLKVELTGSAELDDVQARAVYELIDSFERQEIQMFRHKNIGCLIPQHLKIESAHRARGEEE